MSRGVLGVEWKPIWTFATQQVQAGCQSDRFEGVSSTSSAGSESCSRCGNRITNPDMLMLRSLLPSNLTNLRRQPLADAWQSRSENPKHIRGVGAPSTSLEDIISGTLICRYQLPATCQEGQCTPHTRIKNLRALMLVFLGHAKLMADPTTI